jgi:hypothetical protein
MSKAFANKGLGLVEVTVAGIPCFARVESFTHVEPWKGNIMDCPSDMDYYGYTECEWSIVDRKGYDAEWLQKKVTKADEEAIEEAIFDSFRKEKDYDYD